jgi:hypothetical protein
MFSPYDYYIKPEEYEIASRNGISRYCLETRIRSLGWSKQKATTEAPRHQTDRSEIREVALAHGIKYEQLISRISKGWDQHRAATEPIWDENMFREHMCRLNHMKRKYPLEMIDLAESNGISASTFRYRASHGWDYERAATTPPSPFNGAIRVKELYGEDYFKRLMNWVFEQKAKAPRHTDMVFLGLYIPAAADYQHPLQILGKFLLKKIIKAYHSLRHRCR